MITFTDTQVKRNPVKGKLTVDEEGDMLLSLNGVRILYISNEDGKLRLLCPSRNERQELEICGLTFKDGALKLQV